MPDIFLSYAREDEQSIFDLKWSLEKAGFDVWFDKSALAPGQDWKLEISKAIRTTKVFMVCLSTRSVAKRGFLQAELKEALEVLREVPEGDVFVVPARLDDCQVPDSLRHLQYVNIFEDGAVSALIRSLSSRLRPHAVPVSSSENGIRFSLIRVDRSDLNWADVSLAVVSELFDGEAAQALKLIEFVYDADLLLDVTIRNDAEPTIVTHVGVEIVRVAHRIRVYGFPHPAKIPISDAFVIEIESPFEHFPYDELFGMGITDVNQTYSVDAPDPIYLDSQAAYRFSLRLKQYVGRMPNHALFRIVVRTDRGEARSHVLHAFTL
jgi:hypothetical protein